MPNDGRQADDERVLERIEAQLLERYQQSDADYLEGEQQMMSVDRKADLQDRIVHLDRKIEQVKHEIASWQEDLNDLEIERAASADELDELKESEGES